MPLPPSAQSSHALQPNQSVIVANEIEVNEAKFTIPGGSSHDPLHPSSTPSPSDPAAPARIFLSSLDLDDLIPPDLFTGIGLKDAKSLAALKRMSEDDRADFLQYKLDKFQLFCLQKRLKKD